MAGTATKAVLLDTIISRVYELRGDLREKDWADVADISELLFCGPIELITDRLGADELLLPGSTVVVEGGAAHLIVVAMLPQL